MRRFLLQRDHDTSGISGTGVVAEGVVFSTGKATLAWRTAVTSVAVYDSMADLEAIHGHGGSTRVCYLDEMPEHDPRKRLPPPMSQLAVQVAVRLKGALCDPEGPKGPCSFCGKSLKKVASMIEGPGTFICDECVGLCNEILAEKARAKAEAPPA